MTCDKIPENRMNATLCCHGIKKDCETQFCDRSLEAAL
nr:MAG TPA: hypothetical protein [Caudoviricetes sp.]DAV92595.1 MAG TPA: hypothetical protein [Caudoviricetes sp.]